MLQSSLNSVPNITLYPANPQRYLDILYILRPCVDNQYPLGSILRALLLLFMEEDITHRGGFSRAKPRVSTKGNRG